VLLGGLLDAVRVAGQRHLVERPKVAEEAVADGRRVLVDRREQAWVLVGGGEAGRAERGRQRKKRRPCGAGGGEVCDGGKQATHVK
jgi:hypothetical protein